MTLDEAIKHCEEVAEYNENELSHIDVYNAELAGDASRCAECAADHRQLAEWLTELKEAKRLLRLAVEDFAKLDRENAQHKICMMPEMDCAECPLSWDSIDNRVEPCHCWRYTNEAEKLLGERI